MEAVQGFLAWLGSYSQVKSPLVEVYRDPHTGLSVRAIEDIPTGMVVLQCPYEKSLSYLNACNVSPHFPSAQSFPPRFLDGLKREHPHIIGKFFLMQQYLLGEDSYWWPYIRLLPQPGSAEISALPDFWPEEDLKFLAGTNAEPAVIGAKANWEDEWRRGMDLLKGHNIEFDFPLFLYRWASSIFGSRSFRPSLTLASSFIDNIESISNEDGKLIANQMKNDDFSILWPLIDICNHNGTRHLAWSRNDSNSFGLTTTTEIPNGSQVWVDYGDKSNSELLVSYGFILPADDLRDPNRALIRLKPPPDAGRSQQHCHLVPRPKDAKQDFVYNVRRPRPDDTRPVALRWLDHGLFECVSSIVATKRESDFIMQHPDVCLELDMSMWDGPMSRNALDVLLILRSKLAQELARIHDAADSLG